jgi:MFS transporter, ACS family, hexuronate transporter
MLKISPKWTVLSLLMTATVINYMDRVTLSSASARVVTEMALSQEEFGHVETVFGWGFALGSLLFGSLADRCSMRWLYPLVVTLWSSMAMASGLASGFWPLLITRGLLGFFEAAHWPCALRVTFSLVSEQERTFSNSIVQMGASVGAIIAPQVMKHLMTPEIGSWRSAFIIVGSTGLLWAVLWLVALRRHALPEATTAQGRASILPLLLQRPFWAAFFFLIGAQTVWHMYRVWLMLFLHTGRGYAETMANDLLSLYYVATDAGCLLSGAASLWLVSKWGLSPHRSRRVISLLAVLLTSLSLLLPYLSHGTLLVAVLLLIGAGALSLFPCFYSFVQEISAAHVGRLTGLMSLGVWAFTSPMHSAMGQLADRTGSYDMGLVIAGLAPWAGILAMALLWRSPQQQATSASA